MDGVITSGRMAAPLVCSSIAPRGLSPGLASSLCLCPQLLCQRGCGNSGLGHYRCGAHTLPCYAALGKSCHLSGPPLKHGWSEVRPGLALSFSNSALLHLGIKLGDTCGPSFEIICFIPRQVIKNTSFSGFFFFFPEIDVFCSRRQSPPPAMNFLG